MSLVRSIAALLAGVLLYQVAVVWLGGTLAALAVSSEYLEFFSKQHVALALAFHDLGMWALPVFAVVCGGVYSVLLALRGDRRHTFVALTLGMLACFAYWQEMLVRASVFTDPALGAASAFDQHLRVLVMPWWSVPTYFAPWLGLVAGAWLAARSGWRRHSPTA